MKPEEASRRLTDVRTGKALASHVGSVYWNAYRGRWVSIQLQEWGDSWLGEVWYFEGDTPLGPWVYGQKVITHVMRDETKEEGRRMDEQLADEGGAGDALVLLHAVASTVRQGWRQDHLHRGDILRHLLLGEEPHAPL